ncbi:MAG: GLUG motif-containing protein [Ignavibacteria bacterium]
MKKSIFMFLVTVMFTVMFVQSGNAQTTVTIGSGTSPQQFPFRVYFDYTRSAAIYTSAEIANSGSITHLGWYVSTASAVSIPVKIYLKTTSSSTLTAGDWTTLISGATLVYDATRQFSSTGWNTIDISDFRYSSNNLMVLCEANIGSAVGGGPEFYYSSAANMHEFYQNDGSPPTYGGTVNDMRPNIQLTIAPSGSGTQADPYLIATLSNLYWVTQNSSSWAYGKYFKQTANIDASATSFWDSGAGLSPIGNSTTKFDAFYDGQNFTITGLYINRPSTSNVGLFGLSYGATIQNLKLVNATVTGGMSTGSLIGSASSYYVTNPSFMYVSSTISNCSTTNCNVNSNSANVGGLIGFASGYTSTTLAIISYCYSTGTVTGTTSNASMYGGLIGSVQYYGKVQNCYSTCTVNAANQQAGGFIGSFSYNPCSPISVLRDCYSTGNVTGGNYSGGFVGNNGGYGIIKNCYSTGSVTPNPGNSVVGGFCGQNSGTITDCFWNTTTSGKATSNGGTGKTTAELKTQATFTNWDFSAIWGISGAINSGYPYLSFNPNFWTGSSSSDWNVGGNWSKNTIPNGSDNVIIPNVTNKPVIYTTGSAASIVIFANSSLTVSGTLILASALDNTGTFTSSSSSTVTFNGSLPQNTDGFGTIYNLTIDNSAGVTINSGTTTIVTNSLTINTGKVLTVNGILQLKGSISNSGTLTTTNAEIWFNGSSAQTTSGLTGTVNNLYISNSSGVTLSSGLNITSLLYLQFGLLTLGSNNLTIGGAATIGGTTGASKMVVATGTGELRKTYTAAGSFTFPVGDNTGTAEYSPVTLNFASGTFSSAYAGVKLVNTKHSNNSSATYYLNRYWTVSSSGISGFSCAVALTYLPSDVVGGNESYIWAGKYNGTTWTLLNQANTGTHTLSGTVTGFSDFSGGQQGVLPVSLSSFTSFVNVRDVKLNWVTDAEANNAGFEVERTGTRQQAPGNWEKIGYVQGKGTTNEQTSYTFSDTKLSTGKYQYRLKQIDNNGNFEYHNLNGDVEVGVPKKYEMSQNYPNPFNPMTKIDFQLPNDGKVSLKIYDITGREIATLVNNEFKKADYYTVMFNGSSLSSGVYFYRIAADKYVMTKKMVLLK